MALRSGAGGQPVPPLIDFENCCQPQAAPPLRLRPRARKRCPRLCKLLHTPPAPCPCSSKINNINLSLDFEHGRLSPGVGATLGGHTSLRFPREGHPPASGTTWLASPGSSGHRHPGAESGRDNGRGRPGPGSPRAGEGAVLGPGAGALPARLGRAEGGAEFLCGSASGAARRGQGAPRNFAWRRRRRERDEAPGPSGGPQRAARPRPAGPLPSPSPAPGAAHSPEPRGRAGCAAERRGAGRGSLAGPSAPGPRGCTPGLRRRRGACRTQK